MTLKFFANKSIKKLNFEILLRLKARFEINVIIDTRKTKKALRQKLSIYLINDLMKGKQMRFLKVNLNKLF